MTTQASSFASSEPSSTPASSSVSSESVSCSSSSFGKSFLKALFLNKHVGPCSEPSTPTILSTERTATALMDRLLDQQHQPLDAKDWSITTTRLPSELWFLILRYATYPPFPWSSVSSASHFSTTSLCSSDHHQQNSTTIPFHVRLANYNSELQWKASLTRVCKEWNMWGQEFLWEDVWIASARDGRFLVDIICGRDRCHAPLAADAITTKWGSHTEVRAVGKEKKKRLGFSLKRSRDLQPPSGSQSSALIPHGRLARTPVTSSRQPHPQNRSKRKNVASYIKKLYIETPSMDKCCSIDLLFILERCERLEVFVDLRSVRTGFGFVGVQTVGGLDWSQKGNVKKNAPPPGGPGTIPQRHLFPPSRIPTITPDPILQALLRQKPTLKHLTFTNYKYDSDDFEGGVWFWEDVVGSALSGGNRDGSNLAATLGSLEVVMSTRGVGMGNGRRRLDDHRNPFALSSTPSRRFEDGLLTSLNIDVNPSPLSLSLPSLHSLRIPLTSPTLLVISTWSLPSLQSLCVVSIDFTGWRRMGFKKLMDVHGGGLLRFEIVGGGESVEEEGWITEREDALYGVGHPTNHPRYQHLHLPSTSPNLKHFICSSNASEWNWETPDWIAPHVLMPEHFGVEMIGVWGLEGRVIRGGDWEEGRGGGGSVGAGMGAGSGGRGNDVRGLRRRTINTWTTSRWNGQHSTSSDDSSYTLRQDEEENQHEFEERPFFMLQEQFGSLLRREAFPSLVCIRDMSWESDLIRRSVGIGCGLADSSPSPVADPIPNANAKTETKKLKTKYSLASLKETVASRFAGLTTTPTASSSGSPSPASSSTLTASPTMNASLYRPRTQAQYSKIRKFWLGVLEMCDRRGVYLEDWMGRRVVA